VLVASVLLTVVNGLGTLSRVTGGVGASSSVWGCLYVKIQPILAVTLSTIIKAQGVGDGWTVDLTVCDRVSDSSGACFTSSQLSSTDGTAFSPIEASATFVGGLAFLARLAV